MSRALSEAVKADIGLVSQALDNSNATGKYHSMKNTTRLLALLSGGAMLKTKTTKLELLQGIGAAGGSAKGVPTTVGQLATAEITALALSTELTIALATFLVDGIITINGLDFTAHVDTTTVANREFKIDGNDTADGDELCVCINDPTYGVPGVTASNAAGTVTLVATEPGEKLITVSSVPDDGTVTKTTTKAQAFVELDISKMDLANSFTHIAAKVTTTATSNVAVVFQRSQRFTPIQQVAASKVY
ncbi:hypothetical protein ES703_74182 [subsurface metagenome]